MVPMEPAASASSVGPAEQVKASNEANPRLRLALELTLQHRDLQRAVLTQFRDRSFALLEIVLLGAAIVFAFGASDHGHLEPWMVTLLLIAVGVCLGAACWITLPTGWKTTNWTVPLSGQLKWCDTTDPSVDQCIEKILADAQKGIEHNDRVLQWKRRALVATFAVLGTLIALAVIFWATLDR